MTQKEIAIKNKELIISRYNSGSSVWKIGNELLIAGQVVHKFMVDNNIPRRSMSHAMQKHSINENIFEVINTQEKAYWLGMLYADGGMVKNKANYTIGLTLHRNDRKHIENFKKFLDSSHPITDRLDKLASSITIGNQKLCNDLINKGITLRKSLTITYPEWLEEQYINSFILGIFDGDGCIHCRKRERYDTEQCSFSIVGSKYLMERLREKILEHVGINVGIRSQVNIYRIDIEGNIQLNKLMQWLYKNSPIFLERKHAIFLENVQNYKKEENRIKRNRGILQMDIQGNIIREWTSALDIARILKINRSNITKCCNNQLKTSNGYIWRYKN